MPRMTLPEKLLPLVEKSKRFKIVVGGRGSGKSQSIADICLMDSQTKGIKTACFREFQNSIDDSVFSLLASEITRLDLQGFDTFQNKILFNDDDAFKFRGLARNYSGIQSMHGFNRFWVEEAQTISFNSLKALTPTLRKDDSEIWMSANPMSRADPFSQRFLVPFEKELNKHGYYEDDLHLIIVINYNDNPYFPDVLEKERKYDEDNLPTVMYDHIWRGKFYDSTDNAIIQVEWFDAAIDAHEKLGFDPTGAVFAAYDPSDEGGDSKGYALRQGSVFLDICEKEHGDVASGTDWACDKAIEDDVDCFIWDGDGIGLGLKRQIEGKFSNKSVGLTLFRGSSSPDNAMREEIGDNIKGLYRKDIGKNTYLNMRAQKYWELRDRFYNTWRAVVKGKYIDPEKMISISSGIKNIDVIRSEVCRIPRKLNPNGKIQILSKVEMAKKPYNLPSPNMADSMMMTMVTPESKVEEEFEDFEFKGWAS